MKSVLIVSNEVDFTLIDQLSSPFNIGMVYHLPSDIPKGYMSHSWCRLPFNRSGVSRLRTFLSEVFTPDVIVILNCESYPILSALYHQRCPVINVVSTQHDYCACSFDHTSVSWWTCIPILWCNWVNRKRHVLLSNSAEVLASTELISRALHDRDIAHKQIKLHSELTRNDHILDQIKACISHKGNN
jgi:hypothetical protein